MDTLRYVLAFMTAITVYAGLPFWFLIHPFASHWRKLGPSRTYAIILPVMAGIGILVYRFRSVLLGADLGTNWPLFAIGLALYIPSTRLMIHCRRHLTFRIMAGVPEVSSPDKAANKLLNQGIYSRIRHPRYASASLGLIGTALMANYAGLYLLLPATFLVGHWMVRLEERELILRFGQEYVEYQRDVPGFIPKN